MTAQIDTYRIDYIGGHRNKSFEYDVRNSRFAFIGLDVDLETGNLIQIRSKEYYGPEFSFDNESGDLSVGFKY